MNDLSWILYWASVLPNFATAVGVICTMASIVFVTGTVMSFLSSAGAARYDALMKYEALSHEEREDKRRPPFRYNDDDMSTMYNVTKVSKWLLPITGILALSSNLVPDKETFYAIAASEVGEEVLNTPEVGKARQALNNWLDKQMEPVATTEEATQ